MFGVGLAYFDKLSEFNTGLKYILDHQDFFVRTVDTEGMKTKDPKQTVRTILTMITKKSRPNIFWVEKGTDSAEESKKACKAEGIQFYSRTIETKVAFAERSKRILGKFFYRYMEDYGYKYIRKLPRFLTTLISNKNCLIDLITKNVKFPTFFSIRHSKPLRVGTKKFKNENRVRISKYDWLELVNSQFTQTLLGIVANASRKSPTYTKDEQDKIIRGKL